MSRVKLQAPFWRVSSTFNYVDCKTQNEARMYFGVSEALAKQLPSMLPIQLAYFYADGESEVIASVQPFEGDVFGQCPDCGAKFALKPAEVADILADMGLTEQEARSIYRYGNEKGGAALPVKCTICTDREWTEITKDWARR